MPNALINETSPYLLQHAHNPVNWEPWSTAAFERAARENKLVIISIGYSACHWCHVMERESFEDEKVAQLMNDNYICIKVDREERPDVDQLFMDAAQLMLGRGGWPLNAFALPDGRPVYAGTYFPKIAWSGLLREISFGYKKQPAKYLEYAEKLINGIKGLSIIKTPEIDKPFSVEDLDEAYFSIVHQVDRAHGGRGRAPKFPMPHNWLFLLRYHHSTQNQEALDLTLLTLDKMAEGGIYDQIGGGFARYATDQEWKIPHFEKMLYDNAQLLSLYSEAYLITQKDLYKNVVYDTINFMTRELRSPEGGFYCALDADSEGVEGKFYVWKAEEIDEALGEHAPFFKDYYGVGKAGLWEHGNNILMVTADIDTIASKYGYAREDGFKILNECKTKLLHARNQRVRPGLDNKILFSWNALAVKGLLDAYKVFDEPLFLNLATETFSFMQAKMINGDNIYHSYQNGLPKISGFLEDYAFYIEVLMVFYQSIFHEPYLIDARNHINKVLNDFSDESGFFWFTSIENNELATRKIETSDNVTPSPNSVMAHVLHLASILFDDAGYKARCENMLQAMIPQITEQASFFSNWAILLCYKTSPFYEVAFTGSQAIENLVAFEKRYIPNKVVAGSNEANTTVPLLADKHVTGKSLIYVCQNFMCGRPADNIAEALTAIV